MLRFQTKTTTRSESWPAIIARVLSGSWRQDAQPADVSAKELEDVAPLLLGSGAGSLAWSRIRNSELRDSNVGRELQQAYRLHTLQAALHERDIERAFSLLRSRGIEPVLVKGWSVARLYPEKGMRAYEDIDLVVREEEFASAQALMKEQGDWQYFIDLHRGFGELDPSSGNELFRRSRLVELGETEVRVLNLEDHLRVLCLHLLHHGAFRPLWLCDVAALVESRPDDFDWARCLGADKRMSDWIACTIGLAHQLLGAWVEDTPVAERANKLPGWLIANVLKQWENPLAKAHGVAKHNAPMSAYLRRPSGMLLDLRNRWPDPLEATVNFGGPFNDLPRLPFQLGECLARTMRFFLRLPAK